MDQQQSVASSEQHPVPSSRARALVRGAFDLHVHSAPDAMPRRVTDIELAERFRHHELGGYVIKSHYVPTAERASIVRAVVPGVNVLGSITLNASIGGMNALAIEIAAREGVQLVWFPTVDSANEHSRVGAKIEGAKLPAWAKLQEDLRARGIATNTVHVVDASGALLPETERVLDVIATHQLVLATGHLSRDEIFAVVKAARERGIRRMIVTHPEFPSQNLSTEDQCALAQQGAFLEHCFLTAYSGKVSWETMAANIRATGAAHSILSTDLGQVGNPPVEDGLALMVDRFLDAGFSEEDVRTMAVTNTKWLAEKE